MVDNPYPLFKGIVKHYVVLNHEPTKVAIVVKSSDWYRSAMVSYFAL